jgi:hypothetical protein
MPAGVTGWTAVNGRHALHFEDRLKLDVWYVDHWSLALDLEILARTVWQVLRRQDVDTTERLDHRGFPVAARVDAGPPPTEDASRAARGPVLNR